MTRLLFMGSSMALSVSLTVPALATPLAEADIHLLRSYNSLHSPSMDALNTFLSNNVQTMATPLVVSYGLTQDYRLPLQVLEAQLIGLGLSQGLKYVIQRPRPFMSHPDVRTPIGREGGFTMPSGHATVSFASATAIASTFPGLAVPAYSWATLVSLSRVYNGVHYPSDVLMGALIGVASARLAPVVFSGVNPQLGVSTPPLGYQVGF